MIDNIVLYVNLFFPRYMDKNYDGFVNKSLMSDKKIIMNFLLKVV